MCVPQRQKARRLVQIRAIIFDASRAYVTWQHRGSCSCNPFEKSLNHVRTFAAIAISVGVLATTAHKGFQWQMSYQIGTFCVLEAVCGFPHVGTQFSLTRNSSGRRGEANHWAEMKLKSKLY